MDEVVTSTNDGFGVDNANDRFSVCGGEGDIDDDSKENITSILIIASDVCIIVEDTWTSKDGKL